jgi:hypothetical protein
MILTPIDPAALPHILDTFAAHLTVVPDAALARTAFGRIAETRLLCPGLKADLFAGRDKAIALAKRLGIDTLDEEPAAAFSWDGRVIRTRSETSVLFHEIAHWQVAPAARRGIVDFGVGPGPETGRIADAEAAVCTDAVAQEEEENLSSLLGILWEVEYGLPALMAFAEQNWLEMYDRPSTAQHFVRCVAALHRRGLIDADARPSA